LRAVRIGIDDANDSHYLFARSGARRTCGPGYGAFG
jgi:hypothetical protein